MSVMDQEGVSHPTTTTTTTSRSSKTLYDKVFSNHVIEDVEDGGISLIYIDRHLVHEGNVCFIPSSVTQTPYAFTHNQSLLPKLSRVLNWPQDLFEDLI
jgi:hypothetical protein